MLCELKNNLFKQLILMRMTVLEWNPSWSEIRVGGKSVLGETVLGEEPLYIEHQTP